MEQLIDAFKLSHTAAAQAHPTDPARERKGHAIHYILHAKLAHRMLLTQKFLIRDLYDVACAEIHDKKGLRLALSRLAPREIKHIRAGTRSLSDDWMENDPQKLIGPAYDWGMGEIRQRVGNALESDDGWRRNKESGKAR